jgi:membrane-associated phospholipid phosphatase
MKFLLGMGIATLGVVTGLSWHFVSVRSFDQAYFHKINSPKLWGGIDVGVALFRWLGTKWIFILYLGVMLIRRFSIGSTLILAALITTALESGIKWLIKRPRPFSVMSTAILRQNPVPLDTGFPSGDATRIWFIFATITMGLSPAIGIILGMGLCALFVSFGRVRLGVHYPLDVWAGSALGFGLGLVWAAFLPI